MTSTCVSCNNPVSAQALFCPTCGIRVAHNPTVQVVAPPAQVAVGGLTQGSLIGARYRVGAPIASGAMGSVWRGSDERLHGRACAIKSVLLGGATREEQQERVAWFAREVEVLSRLHHPAICDIRDVISEGGTQYLILELIEGHTLAEELAARGAPGLPEEEVLSWARMLCDALSYLHSQTPPIVFRDLKPQNVMLRPDGRVVLIDFGIARMMQPAGGTAIGTGGYAPPEQYQGLADARSDVYALAATMHHLLTGRDPTGYPPFSYPPIRSLVPALTSHVEAALMQALSIAPDDRFASVASFLAALTSAIPLAPRRKQPASNSSGAQRPMRPPLPGMERLDALVAEARRTKTILPHVLLVGPSPPGTSLRNIASDLATKLGGNIRLLNGGYLNQTGDLIAILTNAQAGDILYIDKVHQMRRPVRETLEEAMSNHTVDFIIGRGPSARTLQMNLQRFTVVGGVESYRAISDVASLFYERIDVRSLDASWKSCLDAASTLHVPAIHLQYPARLIDVADKDQLSRAVVSEAEQLIRSRVKHAPTSPMTIRITADDIRLLPWIVAHYEVDARFSTSVGPIHQEIAEGVFVLDGQSGAIAKSEVAHYVTRNLPQVLARAMVDDLQLRARDPNYCTPVIPLEQVHQIAIDHIVDIHTQTVRYQGSNGREYQKACAPLEQDVTLDTLLVRVMTIEAAMHIGGRDFVASWMAPITNTGSPILLQTDFPDSLPLCQQCGKVDDRDHGCPICGRCVCSRCLPHSTGEYCSVACYEKQQEALRLQEVQRQQEAQRLQESQRQQEAQRQQEVLRQQEAQRQREPQRQQGAQRRQRELLQRIRNDGFRDLVSQTGEQLIDVLQQEDKCVVLTDQFAYIQGSPIVIIGRSGIHSIDVQPRGIWPIRRWEVSVLAPDRKLLVSLTDRAKAEVLAEIIANWASLKS